MNFELLLSIFSSNLLYIFSILARINAAIKLLPELGSPCLAAEINWSIPLVHCPWNPIIIKTVIQEHIFSRIFGCFSCDITEWYIDKIPFLYFSNNSEEVFKLWESSIKFCLSNIIKNRAKSELGKEEMKGDNKSKAWGDSFSLLK